MMKGTGTDNYAGSQLSLFAGTTSDVFNSVMFAMDRRTDGVGGIYLQRRDSSHAFKGTLFQYLDVSGWTFSTASSTTATSTNERMRISPAGNVGIGTTSPDAKLEVSESGTGHGSGGIISETTTHNGNAGYRFRTNGTDRWAITTIGTNGADLRFRDADAGAERMRIDSSGNVGIGTSSPDTKLDITASGVNGVVINQDGSNADISSRLFFKEQNSTIALYNTGNTFSFRTGATINSTSGSERFQVNTNGARVVDGALGVDLSPSTTDGRIDAANDVVAFSTSDKRLKENIKPLDNALDKVLKINGVSFDWKPLTEEEKKTIHGNEGHDVGVIAQEIEEVLPEVVTTRDSGYKAVKYEKIVPLLIEAIKEQQQQIEELKNG